jgi:hypothetical protein
VTGPGAAMPGDIRAGRVSPGLALGAAGLGLVIGLLTYVVWPNVVYGFPLVAGAIAIALLAIGALVWRARRRPASIAIGAGAGLLLGIAIGYNLRPGASSIANVGAYHVDLIEPAIATLNVATATCVVTDGRLMLLESPDAVSLVDGRSVAVTLSRGGYRPFTGATSDSDLTVDVRVAWALDDGTPTETWMGSDGTSVIEVTGTGEAGGATFSGLALRPDSEQREPIDVEGFVSWNCEAP